MGKLLEGMRKDTIAMLRSDGSGSMLALGVRGDVARLLADSKGLRAARSIKPPHEPRLVGNAAKLRRK